MAAICPIICLPQRFANETSATWAALMSHCIKLLPCLAASQSQLTDKQVMKHVTEELV